MGIFDFNRTWSGFSKNAEKKMDKAEEQKKKVASLSPVENDDALVIDMRNVFSAASYGIGMGLFDGAGESEEVTAINAYRELAMRPEVSLAVTEITNEAVVCDYQAFPVSIVFNDDIGENQHNKLAEKTKKVIIEEFENVLQILKFAETAGERFRQWYVDGKCYYHAVLDPNNPKAGIVDIRQIDPRNIKKVVETEEVQKDGVTLKRIKDEYYVYTSYSGSNNANAWETPMDNQLVKLHADSIASSNSGIYKEKQNGDLFAISHLEKAIKPANQLKLLEDALVIYRLARAPERRVFNVDVGSLPKVKAEQYLVSLIAKYRNKMTYDTTTGTIGDQRNIMSMLEDFWLPKREGRGTDISTLPGGQGLGQIEDVDYFRKKLYNSLNVPTSRLTEDGATFNLGRSGEITREEVKFAKFILGLRARFSKFLLKLLEIQLTQKGILTPDEFRENQKIINFQWATDMHWKEMADAEMLNNRLALLMTVEPFVGKYYDAEWVMREILKFDEKEIQLAKERQKQNDIDPNDNDGEEEPMGDPAKPTHSNMPDPWS